MSSSMDNNSPKNKASWSEPIAHDAMHAVHITSSPASQHKHISKLWNFGANTYKKEPSSKVFVGSPDSFIDLVKAIVPTQPQKLPRDPPSPPPPSVPPNTPSKRSVRFSLSPSSKRPNKLRRESGGGRPTPSPPPRPLPNAPSKKRLMWEYRPRTCCACSQVISDRLHHLRHDHLITYRRRLWATQTK